MDFDHIVNVLGDTIGDRELILALQNIGVIAGGSVAYCLNGKGGVKDIDVFMLNSDEVNYIQQIKELFEGKVEQYYCVQNPEKGRPSGVLNVELSSKLPQIQFVFTKLTSLKEVCESFDLDFVVCGIHKGELYYPEKTKEIHETLMIETYTENPQSLGALVRLEKAVKKGYHSYWFDSYPGEANFITKIDIDQFEQGTLEQYRKTGRRCLTDFKIVGFGIKYRIGLTDNGSWSILTKNKQVDILGFVLSMKNGDKTEYLKLDSICMKLTVCAVGKTVVLALSDQARYMFEKVFLGHKCEHELDVQHSYRVSVWMYEGKLRARLEERLDDNYLPFPMIENIQEQSDLDRLRYSIYVRGLATLDQIDA